VIHVRLNVCVLLSEVIIVAVHGCNSHGYNSDCCNTVVTLIVLDPVDRYVLPCKRNDVQFTEQMMYLTNTVA